MIMSKRYNWAVLGCGRIARKFSSDLKLLSNARLYASAARDGADTGSYNVCEIEPRD